MKANAVFQGGGMRGIGIVGALTYVESKGYEWENVAGTSVGSVIAALIAAGYTARDMGQMLIKTDFTKFLDRKLLQRIPLVGKAFGFLKEKGIYSGEYTEKWTRDLLRAKGVEKFKDISVNGKSKLKIIASDITRKDMLILPDDLVKYNIDPMEFDIARAVRMSSSIPFYFKPVKLQYKGGISYIVDGAVCCNFPITIFDDEGFEYPTFGFRFDNPRISYTSEGRTDPLSFLFDIAGTMAKDNDQEYLKEKNAERTIVIPTMGVESTEFNISREKSLELFRAGYRSAREFFKTWDFDEYKRKYTAFNKLT